MRESGYYPPGAEFDPNAPYNQIEPPEVEFEATATVTLNKDADVLTDKVYWDGDDWELCEDVTTSEVWNNNYMDIPVLLAELVKYIDGELEGKPSYQRKWELQKMKESAQGWTVIDDEYELE